LSFGVEQQSALAKNEKTARQRCRRAVSGRFQKKLLSFLGFSCGLVGGIQGLTLRRGRSAFLSQAGRSGHLPLFWGFTGLFFVSGFAAGGAGFFLWGGA
jgi:hypothetical protein